MSAPGEHFGVGPIVLDESIPIDTIEGLGRNILEIRRLLASRQSFGSPADPTNETGSPPTGTLHNGTLGNLAGSWVENSYISQPPFQVGTFIHNLNVPIYDEDGTQGVRPNVAWPIVRISHSGAGPGTILPIVPEFFPFPWYGAGFHDENQISLRMVGASSRTINANNPLRVMIFFVPTGR